MSITKIIKMCFLTVGNKYIICYTCNIFLEFFHVAVGLNLKFSSTFILFFYNFCTCTYKFAQPVITNSSRTIFPLHILKAVNSKIIFFKHKFLLQTYITSYINSHWNSFFFLLQDYNMFGMNNFYILYTLLKGFSSKCLSKFISRIIFVLLFFIRIYLLSP